MIARLPLVAIALATLGSAARAGELTSTGPLALRAPDNLVLGRDTTAVIRLRSEPGLRFVTTAGTLGAPAPDGADQQVTLTLPAQAFPQLAIVAAIASDGSVRDWLAIPLAGQARVKVDTEKRAKVVVRVGTAEFGPVQADARGVAHVDIVVPPGITSATTIATGIRGAVREKPMPLGVQPATRTLAVCGASGDRVSVIATTSNGAPATSAPRLSSTTGAFTTMASPAPGLFVVAFDDSAATTDTADVAVAFDGEDAIASRCRLDIPPEAPTAMRIVADRTSFVAGTGALSLAIAFEFRGARHPLDITTVAIDTDAGTVAAPRRNDDKTFSAVWTLPDAFRGRRAARASARVRLPNGRELTAHLDVPLVATTPVRVEASGPGRLRANGASTGVVTARVVDRFDNPVAGAQLQARARGRLEGLTAGPDGMVTARYVAPHTRDPGDDVVELTHAASGLTSRARVPLDALPRRFAFSARVGYLSNLGRVATPLAGVTIDARLPVLDEHLVAGLAVVGYSQGFEASAMDTGESVSARVSTMVNLARIAYRRELGPVDVWIGGGAGLALASTRIESQSSGMQRASATPFAATGFIGAATRVGPGWLLVEGAYVHAMLPDAAIAGRLGGVVATTGFALER